MKRVGEPGAPTASAELPAAKKPRLKRALPATGRQQAAIDVERAVEERSRVSRGVRSSTDANHSYDDPQSSPAVTSHPSTSLPSLTAAMQGAAVPEEWRFTSAELAQRPGVWPSQQPDFAGQRAITRLQAPAHIETGILPVVQTPFRAINRRGERVLPYHALTLNRRMKTANEIKRNGLFVFHKPNLIGRPFIPGGSKSLAGFFSGKDLVVKDIQEKFLYHDQDRIAAIVEEVYKWQGICFDVRLMEREPGLAWRDFCHSDFVATRSTIEQLIQSDCTLPEIAVAMADIGSRGRDLNPDFVPDAARVAIYVTRDRDALIKEIKAAACEYGLGVRPPDGVDRDAQIQDMLERIDPHLKRPMIEILLPTFQAFVHGEIPIGRAFQCTFDVEKMATDRVPEGVCDIAAAIGLGAVDACIHRNLAAGQGERAVAIDAVATCLARYVNDRILPLHPFGTATLNDARYVNIVYLHEFFRRTLSESPPHYLVHLREHFRTWCAGVFQIGVGRLVTSASSNSGVA